MPSKKLREYAALRDRILSFLKGQEELVEEHSADAIADMVAFDLELEQSQLKDCNAIVCDWYYDQE